MTDKPKVRPESFERFQALPEPPCAIDGSDRFICVIFSDADAEAGVKVIRKYLDLNFKVWYDTSPSSRTMFSGATRDALDACEVAVFVHNKGSTTDPYYFYLFRHVWRMKQRRYILHMEPFRQHSMPARACDMPINPEEESFDRILKHVYSNASQRAENDKSHSRGDPGIRIESGLSEKYSVINLRTHETWNQDRYPMGVADSEEIDRFVKYTQSDYLLLPVSYAADYSESGAERAAMLKADRERRTWTEAQWQSEEAEKRCEEETQSKTREYYRNHTFPQGYPYMDEFERLGSD